MSTLEFPGRPNVIYKIRTELLGNTWEFLGKIVWEREIIPDIHQNGVMFRMNENQRASLLQMLNQLSIHLRGNPLVPNSSFMAVDKKKYLLLKLSQHKNPHNPYFTSIPRSLF